MAVLTRGEYRPLQSADAEAARARIASRYEGDAFVVAGRADPVQRVIAGLLAEHGLDPVRVRPRSLELPDPAGARLIILTGGEPYAVARTEAERRHELAWLRAADTEGTPILGIGHGARALADALGGRVVDGAAAYRGWAFVDTIAPHQIAGGPWPTWQHDRIRLPRTAELIAENLLGPQAFRIGPHLGVQFHPEATPSTVARWTAADATESASTTRRDPAAARASALQLFRTFLRTL